MSGGLTVERLRALLDYHPETGVFLWRTLKGSRCPVDRPAGYVNPEGYRYIGIDRRVYLAHHLGWLYAHGVWPSRRLDHRNGRPDDNRIANLREDLSNRNQQNTGTGPRRNNSHGFLGVERHRRRWMARITADGKRHNLGTFDTPEEAHDAYIAAKRRLHPFWDESRMAVDAG